MPRHLTEKAALQELGVTRSWDYSARMDAEPQHELRGSAGVRAYNAMRLNSAVAGAALFAIEMTLRRIDDKFVSDVPGDERVRFLEECKNDMSNSWNDFKSNALLMMSFGWAFLEVIYKQRLGQDQTDPAKYSKYKDGRIGWRKFALREHLTLHDWKFSDDGSLLAMIQQTNARGRVEIPIEKGLLFRTRAEGNSPEGQSLLRTAFWNWYYTRNLSEIEAIGIERNLVGVPVMFAPEGADLSEGSDDRVAAENLLARIRNDEAAGVLVPPGWDFQLLGISGATGNSSTSQVINRHESRIALSVLSQFLMLGLSGASGSYSLSSTHADLFLLAVDAFASIITETFTRFEIPRILKLNGMSLENMPRLVHEPVRADALKEVSAYFSSLASMGLITPDTELENWLRELAEAPSLDSENIKDVSETDPKEYSAWSSNKRQRDRQYEQELERLERKGEREIKKVYGELVEAMSEQLG